jgi:hypothetical protein
MTEPIVNNKHTDLGYFGNIWIRQNVLEKKGEAQDGHRHYFDHVTMLVKGSVSVSVEGEEPKEFVAPTFIVIKKELKHQIVALEDDVIYYCVFALRNLDGEVIEDIYGEKHNPRSARGCHDNWWERQEKLAKLNI